MTLPEIITDILGPLVGNRVWFNTTPDSGPTRDASGRFQDFIIASRVGGQDAEYVEQTMGTHTNARIQIHAVSAGSIGAELLIRAARDRLLASDYTVGVYGSPVGTYDAARKLHGNFQQFSIWYPEQPT